MYGKKKTRLKNKTARTGKQSCTAVKTSKMNLMHVSVWGNWFKCPVCAQLQQTFWVCLTK